MKQVGSDLASWWTDNWRAIAVAVGLVVAAFVWTMVAGAVLLLILREPLSLLTPLVYAQYAYYYGHIPKVHSALAVAAMVGLLPPIGVLSLIFKARRRPLHGRSQWATLRELVKAGLFQHAGIVIGKFGRRLMHYNGDTPHVLVAAPTGSGKGVSIVIPNCLAWKDSLICLDMKKENWDATAAFRAAHGQACYCFDPGSPDGHSHCFNPLDYVSREAGKAIEDLQRIGNMLFPDVEGVQPIWTRTPRFLFIGIALYLMETGQPLSIGEVLSAGMSGDPYVTFDKIIKDRAKAGQPLSAACIKNLGAYLDISAKETRAGIIAGFRSSLELWQSPSVNAATSRSDFDLRDVRRRRMSIYFVCRENDMERLQPLVRLFFQLAVSQNTVTLPKFDATLKHECLLILDEFPSFGKLDSIVKGIAFVRGYGLRLLTILQSPAQIPAIYGKDAAVTFLSNHGAQIAFPPKRTETETLKEMSEWLGFNTETGLNKTRTANLFEKVKRSESEQDQRRALLLPQEIAALPQGRCIVIVENTSPILGTKIRYYADRVFKERANFPAALPAVPMLNTSVQHGEVTSYTPEVFIGDPNPEDVELYLSAALDKFGIDLKDYVVGTDAAGVDDFLSRFTYDLAPA